MESITRERRVDGYTCTFIIAGRNVNVIVEGHPLVAATTGGIRKAFKMTKQMIGEYAGLNKGEMIFNCESDALVSESAARHVARCLGLPEEDIANFVSA